MLSVISFQVSASMGQTLSECPDELNTTYYITISYILSFFVKKDFRDFFSLERKLFVTL